MASMLPVFVCAHSGTELQRDGRTGRYYKTLPVGKQSEELYLNAPLDTGKGSATPNAGTNLRCELNYLCNRS